MFSSCSLFNKTDEGVKNDTDNVVENVNDESSVSGEDITNDATDKDSDNLENTDNTSSNDQSDIKEIIWDDDIENVDDSKTDEEVVKEFEEELDSLFELLEWDGE